ncbi:MAG: hypothetical protein KGI03_03020 [Patescibacteria group bacterium]|nr:hypothetical protein [Patescibacteria group bacterium]
MSTSELEQTDPQAFEALVARVKEEGDKLLQPGESFSPQSYEMIARYVAREAAQAGSPLTRESVEALDSAHVDSMLDAAVVRFEQDNAPKAYVVSDAAQSTVVGKAGSFSEAMRLAEEQQGADTR